MKKWVAQIRKNKDLNTGVCLVLGLVFVCAKLVLSRAQNVFLWPEEALLDDMVMYDAAVSIAEGGWLGIYGYKTLAKNSFFALWLAGLHKLGLPFLLGGQMLWAGAAFAAARAFAPALKRRWQSLLLFVVLLFSPSSMANPQMVGGSLTGFVARVYRDNIFPALCVLVVAGMVGFALRYGGALRRSVGWLVLAGLGLVAAWLCREDGWWLLPFVLVAAGVALWYIVREGLLPAREKTKRALALLLPLGLLGAGLLGWAGANQAVYGRFILNDFSGGEFADAYGAMTRVQHEDWDPKIDVPRDVRQKLYEQVPAFAQLQPLLESEWYLGRYAGQAPQADYSSGAFYWALREAAAERGYYDTPQKAQAYFAQLATEINAVCDAGLVAAGARRSSVNPPIRAAYIGPVVAEGLYSLWFCATFQQCDARSIFSPHANDPTFYEETIAPMEAFLHEKALTATQENSTQPYYSPWQRLCYGVFDAVRLAYAALLPCGLVAALCWQVWQGVRLWKRLRLRRRTGAQGLLWLAMLGVLFCMMLRCLMIAYVTVSSFTIGTYVAYLAPVHPLMLVYAVVGVVQLWRQIALRRVVRARRSKKAVA